MPWLSLYTEKEVGAETQDALRKKFGEVLAEELGKEEAGLYVTFHHPDGMHRAGVATPDAAAIEVRYIGSAGLPKKQAATGRLCRIVAESLYIDSQKIIVLFREYKSQDWGRRAGEYR